MATDSLTAWHCSNPKCHEAESRHEILAQEEEIPVCSCGLAMRKRYKPPVFRYLEFLELEYPEPARNGVLER